MAEPWWSISGEEFLRALRAVAEGNDPDAVYAEWYVNADRETVEDIREQRRQGWPDFHPEDYCHRCGRPNVDSWYVDPELWRQAVSQGDLYTVLCPQCFTKAWEEMAGQSVTWVLSIDPATVEGGV